MPRPRAKKTRTDEGAGEALTALEVDGVPLTRGPIQELAARLEAQGVTAGELSPACAERFGPDAAVALLLAGAVAGQRTKAVHVAPVVTGSADPVVFAALLGRTQGDRVGCLLDAVESGRAPDDREALALFLATHLEAVAARAEGREVSQRLRALLRRVARRNLEEEPAALLALAALELNDPDVLQVCTPWMPDAKHPEYKKLASDLREALAAPLLDALPELAPKVVSGLTVRRVTDKVGRNDPCPCGSGKKYKKCCEGKDAQSGIVGMSRADYLAKVASKLSPEDLQAMRADDLELLDYGALGEKALLLVMRRLAAFARWPAAEKALGALTARTDLVEKPDAYRCDLVASALAARAFDVAERVRGTLADPEALPAGDALSIALLRPSGKTLRQMEALAYDGLATEPKGYAFTELAYALLDHYPALGILVARSSLHAERPKDSNAMLDHIEDARDQLGLPPRDPAWDAFDELLDRDVSRRLAEVDETGESERLAAEADALRMKVRGATEHIEALSRKLRAQEEALQQATAASERATPSAAEVEDAQERKRMRAKLEELKGQIATGNRERADLRKRLAEATEELAPRLVAQAAPDEHAGEDDDDEEGESLEDSAEERDVLVPVFAPNALKGIADAPPKVAREAVVLASRIASGDPAAWRGCKRLLAPSPPVYSARCGIRHRLLFRPADGRLDVLELVPRREFETVLKRY